MSAATELGRDDPNVNPVIFRTERNTASAFGIFFEKKNEIGTDGTEVIIHEFVS